jgi:hypothetical protein
MKGETSVLTRNPSSTLRSKSKVPNDYNQNEPSLQKFAFADEKGKIQPKNLQANGSKRHLSAVTQQSSLPELQAQKQTNSELPTPTEDLDPKPPVKPLYIPM